MTKRGGKKTDLQKSILPRSEVSRKNYVNANIFTSLQEIIRVTSVAEPSLFWPEIS